MADLNLPVPGSTSGPQWAVMNNANLTAINNEVEAISTEVDTINGKVDTINGTLGGRLSPVQVANQEQRQVLVGVKPNTAAATLREMMVSNGNLRVGVVGSSTAASAMASYTGLGITERLAARHGATSVADLDTAPTTGTGIQWYKGAVGGTTSATYLPSTRVARVGTLALNVLIHIIGSNDWATNVPPATYQSNMTARASEVEAAKPGIIQVFVHSQPRLDGPATYAWSAYRDALANVVAIDPTKRVLVDVTSYIEAQINGTNKWRLVNADNIHLSDAGYKLVADILGMELGIPRTDPLTPTYVEMTFPVAAADLSASTNLSVVNIPAAAYPRRIRFSGHLLVRNLIANADVEFQFGLATAATTGTPLRPFRAIRKGGGTGGFLPNDPVTLAGSFFLAANEECNAVINFVRYAGSAYVSNAATYTGCDIELLPI